VRREAAPRLAGHLSRLQDGCMNCLRFFELLRQLSLLAAHC
jgi:hypothetical protein